MLFDFVIVYNGRKLLTGGKGEEGQSRLSTIALFSL